MPLVLRRDFFQPDPTPAVCSACERFVASSRSVKEGRSRGVTRPPPRRPFVLLSGPPCSVLSLFDNVYERVGMVRLQNEWTGAK